MWKNFYKSIVCEETTMKPTYEFMGLSFFNRWHGSYHFSCMPTIFLLNAYVVVQNVNNSLLFLLFYICSQFYFILQLQWSFTYRKYLAEYGDNALNARNFKWLSIEKSTRNTEIDSEPQCVFLWIWNCNAIKFRLFVPFVYWTLFVTSNLCHENQFFSK